MLVLMVRGLFSQLEFPYVQFPCNELSGDQLYEPLWEAVGRLERCGFCVMALVCDGLAANRRLFRLHAPESTASDVYKVQNPYSTDGRFLYIYFFGPTSSHENCEECMGKQQVEFMGKARLCHLQIL